MNKYTTVFGAKPMFITIIILLVLVGGFFLFRSLNKKYQLIKPRPARPQTPDDAQAAEEEEILQDTSNMAPEVCKDTELCSKNEKGFITNVFRVRNGRTELVELKLKHPLGSGMDREPAVPFKGRYFAVETINPEDKKVTYKPYDPREEAILSNNTPEDCWDATHWDTEVDDVYANSSDWSDKVSLVIIALAIIANFIVALVALGKIGN